MYAHLYLCAICAQISTHCEGLVRAVHALQQYAAPLLNFEPLSLYEITYREGERDSRRVDSLPKTQLGKRGMMVSGLLTESVVSRKSPHAALMKL